MRTTAIYKSPAGEKAIMAFYEAILAHWPVPCTRLNIPTRSGGTFVIASGAASAPPLVQLHGSSTNSAMWAGAVAAYSRHYRVYSVDTLGEPGKSAPHRPALKSPAYAEWLEDIFDALAIDRAVLMGYSQGGWLALKFATYRPERVSRLVLLAPGGVTPVRLAFVLRLVALSLFGQWGAASIKRMVYGGLSLPGEVEEFIRLIENYYHPRTDSQPLFSDEELKRLTMPTLLVAGARDCCYISEKIAARLQRVLPHFEANILPEAGHAMLDTTPQVIPFLTAVGRPG
jgi:pimeloyl-ACP methyl ester carboxylesterase